MTFQHRPPLAIAIAIAASLAFAACKKDPPASPPAGSGDTAAAPRPSATPPEPRAAPPTVAQPRQAAPETPPPALPSQEVAPPDDSADEGSADRTGAAEGSVEIADQRRLAAMQRRANQIHEQLDANHDGVLSPEELANAHGRRARFDDPFALDTNHDGDISPDELAAGLKARAEARRAEHIGAEGGSQQP